MNTSHHGERTPGPVTHAATRAVARVLLTVYGIGLALIVLWPTPVDANAGRLLRAVGRAIPLLTYPRIEFAANILLFVPLGLLLMLIMRRRYLILPIAIVVTVTIESVQGLLLDRRTPTMLDIIANTAGACIGMLIVALVEGTRSRESGSGSGSASSPEERAAKESETWAALGLGPPPPPPKPQDARSPGPPPPLPPRPAASDRG
jgi:hypothetical protein